MENKKGNGIFLGVIGVATLIVAIIGATFAYFSASTNSADNAISVNSTQLSLGFSDETSELKTNLIPASDTIAKFGATDATHIASKGTCIDDNGNEVCGVYDFFVGNPSGTTAQKIYANITVVSNTFDALYFTILDETGTAVVPATSFKFESDSTNTDSAGTKQNADGTVTYTQKEGKDVLELNALSQTLLASDASVSDTDKNDSSKYTLKESGASKNYRNYKVIVWVRESGKDQTNADAGKAFSAGINITTEGSGTGVTGVIAAAQG